MSVTPEQVSMTHQGRLALQVGFELFAVSNAPLQELAAGVVSFHQVFMERYGSLLTCWRDGNMVRNRRIDARTREIVPHLFSSPRTLKSGELLFVAYAGQPDAPLLPCLEISAENGETYVAMILPHGAADAGADALIDLAGAALERFPYTSGHAGYALFWDAWRGEPAGPVASRIRALLHRHPGLDHGDHLLACDRGFTSINGVNWLTLLGPALAAQVGGREALTRRLGPEIPIHAIGAGIGLQAGAAPALGDVNRGETLPLYRRVGAALRELRSLEYVELPGMDEDASEAWLARFDTEG